MEKIFFKMIQEKVGKETSEARLGTKGHAMPNVQQADCYNWLGGNCTRGKDCKFKHTPNLKGFRTRKEEEAGGGNKKNREKSADNGNKDKDKKYDKDKSKIPCRNYLKGSCTYESNCISARSRRQNRER